MFWARKIVNTNVASANRMLLVAFTSAKTRNSVKRMMYKGTNIYINENLPIKERQKTDVVKLLREYKEDGVQAKIIRNRIQIVKADLRENWNTNKRGWCRVSSE